MLLPSLSLGDERHLRRNKSHSHERASALCAHEHVLLREGMKPLSCKRENACQLAHCQQTLSPDAQGGKPFTPCTADRTSMRQRATVCFACGGSGPLVIFRVASPLPDARHSPELIAANSACDDGKWRCSKPSPRCARLNKGKNILLQARERQLTNGT